MAFQVGDVVQLHSGGPFMTVTSVESSSKGPRLLCEWFHDNRRDDAVFPEASLKSKAQVDAEFKEMMSNPNPVKLWD